MPRDTAVLTGESYRQPCPFMGDCWANQGCWRECPDDLADFFAQTARLEHELGMLPHNDADIETNCREGCNA